MDLMKEADLAKFLQAVEDESRSKFVVYGVDRNFNDKGRPN